MVSQQISFSKGQGEENSLAQIIRTLESEICDKDSDLQLNSHLSISKAGESSFDLLSDISDFGHIYSSIKVGGQGNADTTHNSDQLRGFCNLCGRERDSLVRVRNKRPGLWNAVEYLFYALRCCTDHEKMRKFQEFVYTCSKCGTVMTKSTIKEN